MSESDSLLRIRRLGQQLIRERSRTTRTIAIEAGIALALELGVARWTPEANFVAGLVIQPFLRYRNLSRLPIPARMRRQWELEIGQELIADPRVHVTEIEPTVQIDFAANVAGLLDTDLDAVLGIAVPSAENQGTLREFIDRGILLAIPGTAGKPSTHAPRPRPAPPKP
jgi:hypothetical protein